MTVTAAYTLYAEQITDLDAQIAVKIALGDERDGPLVVDETGKGPHYMQPMRTGTPSFAVNVSTLTVGQITANDSSLGVNGENAAQGGAIVVTGGTSATAANAGGAVSLVGGTPGASGIGGAVAVTGAVGGASAGAGGAVAVAGGAATAAATAGGAVTVTGGLGTTSGFGGGVSVTGGASGTTGQGGSANLVAGAGGSTSGAGGVTSVTGGAGGGTGAGGAASITGGASGGGATGNGGLSKVVGGAATSTDGTGGAAQVTGGVGTGSGAGGAITITSGAAGATGVAGAVNIAVGGATAGNGSAVTITGGNGAGGTASGGNVNLVPGTAVSTGTPGEVLVNGVAGTFEVTYTSPLMTTAVPASGTAQPFYIATRAVRVKKAYCSVVTHGTSETIAITKDASAGAPGSGTNVLAAVMTPAANNTPVTQAASATIATCTLAAGDRLSFLTAGTIGSAAGLTITVLLVPV